MNIVLVHGGFCGGWWMSKLARALRRRGAEVLAPTLTGLGERVHLASPDVGLDTHIQDVLNVLHFEDLRDVVLVGHSYGGAVVSGAADRARDRIRRLIYFDAFVLRNGESVADVFGPEATEGLKALAVRDGGGWRAPSPFGMEQFGVTDPELVAWNERGNVMHPLKTLTDTLEIGSDPLPFPVSYIYCKEMAMGLFDSAAAIAKERGWDYHEAAMTHAGPAVAPEESADLLMKIANGS